VSVAAHVFDAIFNIEIVNQVAQMQASPDPISLNMDPLNGLRNRQSSQDLPSYKICSQTIASSENLFLGSMPSGPTSPVDIYSPTSNYTNDGQASSWSIEYKLITSVFSDGLSDSSQSQCSPHWDPLSLSPVVSHPASPSLSYTSLSPLEEPFNNFSLSEDELFVQLSQSRDQSPVRAHGQMSPADFTFDLVTADGISMHGWNSSTSSLEIGPPAMVSAMTYSNDTTSASSSQHRPRSASVGGTVNFPEQFDNDAHAHGDFLTVPNPSLVRRGATSGHRRTHTHSGSMPGMADGMGRGRPLGPAAHAHGRHHSVGRVSDYAANPGAFRSQVMPQIQTDLGMMPSAESSSPGTPYSSSSSNYSTSPDGFGTPSEPSPHTPGSPFQHLNVDILPPGDNAGLFRRSSESLTLSQEFAFGTGDGLHRASSDPTTSTSLARKGSRSKTQTHRRIRSGSNPYVHVFKPESVPIANVAIDTSAVFPSGGAPDMQGGIALPSCDIGVLTGEDPESEFKVTVGSDKIKKAASSRRVHQARFACDLCDATFTARHNLNNHMNSHTGEKPFACQWCDQRAVTQAVILRHERKSCKKRPAVGTKASRKRPDTLPN
jgi:hypothetical protein